MNELPQPYSFPRLSDLVSLRRGLSQAGAPEAQAPDAAVEEAIRRGYEEGLAQGRASAAAEVDAAEKAAHEQGLGAGRAEGVAEAERAVSAMREALKQIEEERGLAAEQLESFAVDLALAIVSRLVEVDSVRADFVTRLAAGALKALAPERPHTVYLNPADRALLGSRIADLPVKDDETLAPGHARVEAGSLFVEGGVDRAFEQLKAAAFEVRERRLRKGKKA